MEVKKYFTTGEEIFNSIVHGIGALLAIAGLVLLIIKANTPAEDVGVIIFGSCAIILYTMSSIYHAFPKGITKNIFERFDHASIYMLIAASYTPLCLIAIGGAKGWILFGIQWGLALIGIVLKSVWIDKFVILHVFIYLLMGWAIVFLFRDLLLFFNEVTNIMGFYLLFLGGILYSIGTVFYIFPLFKFHHAIWHFFVLFGTILHFLCLYLYVV